jgi:hypothetical protein
MNYGNANDLIQHCPRCAKSIDKHGIALIRSDETTEKLAKKMQENLDAVAHRSADKGFEPMRTSTMVGAATATIGTAVYKYVTISGGATEMLAQMANMGKDVEVITATTAAPLTTIRGEPLVMAPTAHGRNRDYPVGSCAAQKMIMAIFKKAKEKKAAITAINMAEILWSDPHTAGHNRDWSTGSVVCSCDTCKRVVPAMLCDHRE